MARQGREFEELVARIEKLLIPAGAEIKSPDFIKHKVTGKPREFDVSIRSKVGSASILIVLECRKRGGNQDIMWIDGLVTKGRDVGAAKIIAVSSGGFSKHAIEVAKLHGIDIRTIKEISDDEISDWPNILKFDTLQINCKSGPLIVAMYNDQKYENILLDQVDGENYQQLGLNAEVLIRDADSSRWSISKICSELSKSNAPAKILKPGEEQQLIVPPNSSGIFASDPVAVFLLQGVPFDGNPVSKKLTFRFPKWQFSVKTNYGNCNVYELTIDLTISCSKTGALPTKIVEYSSDKKSIIQLAETEILLDESKNLKVTITQSRLLEEIMVSTEPIPGTKGTG